MHLKCAMLYGSQICTACGASLATGLPSCTSPHHSTCWLFLKQCCLPAPAQYLQDSCCHVRPLPPPHPRVLLLHQHPHPPNPAAPNTCPAAAPAPAIAAASAAVASVPPAKCRHCCCFAASTPSCRPQTLQGATGAQLLLEPPTAGATATAAALLRLQEATALAAAAAAAALHNAGLHLQAGGRHPLQQRLHCL